MHLPCVALIFNGMHAQCSVAKKCQVPRSCRFMNSVALNVTELSNAMLDLIQLVANIRLHWDYIPFQLEARLRQRVAS